MNNKEIIQALKDNEKPFCLMSNEMRSTLLKITKGDGINDLRKMVIRPDYNAGWGYVTLIDWNDSRNWEYTYRLRPDYTEEPEVVECEVVTQRFETEPIKFRGPSGPTCLHKAISHQDFIGFKYEGGCISPLPRIFKVEECGIAGLHWTMNEACLNEEKWEVLTPTHVLFRKEQK